MGKKVLIGLIAIVFIIALWLLYIKTFKPSNTQTTTKTPPTNSQIFSQVISTVDGATWTIPENTTEQTGAGNLTGQKVTSQITTKEANVTHFENEKELIKLGYESDPSLSADGPGSSMWGYKSDNEGETNYIIYSYKVAPSSNNPNEPLQFNCPCKTDLSVFISAADPNQTSQSSTSLANPASVNCEKVGGTNKIMTMGNGGQYGLCYFEDNMACEEWALMRGECPVGGIKTTGYDNVQQSYCAWIGGKTLAVANSTCTLPDGKVCSTAALYNGTCPAN